MIQAFLFLSFCSLKNRIKSRVRRLKQPKYLVGGIVGALYFYGFVVRNMMHGRWRGGPGPGDVFSGGPGLAGLEDIGAWVLSLLALAAWLLPSRRAALEFSEAEIQFLFPAPISRTGLLHYKLVSWQIGLLFTSVVMCCFGGRLFEGLTALQGIVGCWLALFLIRLHGLGASFARSRWLQGGGSGGNRAWWILPLIGGVGFAGLAWAWSTLPAVPSWQDFEPEAWLAWVRSVSGSGPWVWMLWPARCVVRLALSRDFGVFAGTLPIILVFVSLHYVWVIRGAMSFEEAAVEAARVADERLQAAKHPTRPRQVGRSGTRRAPFVLRPEGPPWVALAWKNLIGAGAAFRGIPAIAIASILIPTLLVGASLGQESAWPTVVGGLAVLLLALSAVIGPGILRCDVRSDLGGTAELLKVLPLAGWQIVLGSMMAPWGILCVSQGLLALVAAVWIPAASVPGGLDGTGRVVLWATSMLLLPAISFVGLGLQNGAAILFPAWISPVDVGHRGGLERMGQQIIVFAAQAIGFVFALLPAVILGGAMFAVSSRLGGPWWALFPAGAASAMVLAGEAAFLIWLLGACWERMDLAREQVG